MVVVSPASTRTPRVLLFLYAVAGCFLLSLSHHVAAAASPPSFRFDFPNTSSYSLQDLRFEGSAAQHDNLVDLTCTSEEQSMSNCTGRMSYNHPVPFYDNTTGEVASFATQFTFAIRLIDGRNKGDGIAFFLSYYPSTIPPRSSGSYLGLMNGGEQTASGAGRFIAVEFDTYANPWDPTGSSDHIGIDISSLDSVKTTTLANLSLSGSMTASITFNNSTRMLAASLHFDDDPSLAPAQVSTRLPYPLTKLLPPEVAVGFSASTGGSFELHQIVSWSFNSTLARKETPEPNGQQKQGEALGDKGHRIDTRVIIGVAVLSVPVVWFILSCFMWKRMDDSFAKRAGIGQLPRYEFQDLAEATGKFSKKNKIGQGAFGVVYKGSLKDKKAEDGRREVAVKKILKESGEETIKDFVTELETISETRHKNLVRLHGWGCGRNGWNLVGFMCWCRQQKIKLFLVYELVPNGNLHDHLCKDEQGQVLSWELRYKIVKDIGSALRYLHHDCNPCILHRDIKPGNILLDKDFNAKLADFGLSRIANHNNTSRLTTAIGSIGYMDPQLMRKDQKVNFNRKSDVYSFGIVLLEIACTGKSREEVQKMYTNRPEKFMEAAADDKLRGAFDKEEMERVVVMGLRCSDPDGIHRPFLDDAMQFLEHGKELPDINSIEGGDNAISMAGPSSEQPLVSPATPSLPGSYYN